MNHVILGFMHYNVVQGNPSIQFANLDIFGNTVSVSCFVRKWGWYFFDYVYIVPGSVCVVVMIVNDVLFATKGCPNGLVIDWCLYEQLVKDRLSTTWGKVCLYKYINNAWMLVWQSSLFPDLWLLIPCRLLKSL